MVIDPSSFHRINVADTCSVWNILSSIRLYAAAREANCEFCMTAFVHYECLVKPRTNPTEADLELRERLKREQQRGRFKAHSCTINDLQRIADLENRKRLGKGELSSIAFAMSIRQAFITDDKKARKLSVDVGNTLTQTTPHLHSWLIFKNLLTDTDHNIVTSQHQSMGGTLGPHFNTAYDLALQYRYNMSRDVSLASAGSSSPPVSPTGPPAQRNPDA
jgi:predicted nucleic acid-binding protein